MNGQKTGGRKKGTPNKKTLMVSEIANKIAVDPLEVLLRMAAGDWKGLGYEAECYFSEKPDGAVKMGYVISPETRLQAAKEASQYLYPKRKEQPPENKDLNEIEVTSIEDKKKLIAQAEKEIQKLKEEVQDAADE